MTIDFDKNFSTNPRCELWFFEINFNSIVTYGLYCRMVEFSRIFLYPIHSAKKCKRKIQKAFEYKKIKSPTFTVNK